MTDDGISEEVRDFLTEHIDSVEGLEVLLLLRVNPGQELTALAVSQKLRSDVSSAAIRLTDLCRRGLLTSREASSDVFYRYDPKTDKFRSVVDGLAVAYNERRVRVINLIFSKPIDKIRVFADAFKFKKDK